MKCLSFRLVASLLCMLVAGCGPKQFGAHERELVGADVAATLQAYADAVKTGGLTAEFAYLDSSKDFYWVPPGFGSALSYDSVAVILRRNAPMFKEIDNDYVSMHVVPLTSEFASYHVEILSKSIDTAGNTSQTRLLETGVMVKRVDGWKLLHGQTAILENEAAN